MFESLKMKKRSIILDTDIGPDCDDVGALAVLFSYAKEYNTDILGVCNCTSNVYGSATVDALKEFCNAPDFKIGMYSKPGFVSYEAPRVKYSQYVAEAYSKKYNDGTLEILPHVSFYRSLLADAEDDGVVVVTIGMFNTFADFLRSGPDKYSELSGLELAAKKIHAVVSMAAILPEGREFNVVTDYPSAKFCFENCPVPMYLSDFHIGAPVLTGYSPEEAAKHPHNPIVESYQLYTKGFQREGFNSTIDLTAVQFAFEGEGELYSLTAPGRLEFYNADPEQFEADATRYVEDENGKIYFMKKVASDEEIAKSIQARIDEYVL